MRRVSCRADGPSGRSRAQAITIDPMGTKLYVGNLNFTTTEDALKAAFAANGRTVKVSRLTLNGARISPSMGPVCGRVTLTKLAGSRSH